MFIPFGNIAQVDSIPPSNDSINKFHFTFIADAYFSYDLTQSSEHQKADFLYNYKRNKELNFNFLYFKTAYSNRNKRANLAFHTGNYAQYNYANEPTLFQFINEASVGIQLSKKYNLWIDGGIMPSHIGFESAINTDCANLTRSVLAENSPYFETGIKLSYVSTSEKWAFNLLGLNGWQRIAAQSPSFSPSMGLQITFTPSKKWLINYSNFVGVIKSDVPFNRMYHNFYAHYKTTKKINFTAGIDLGMDTHQSVSSNWLAAVFILQKEQTKKLKYAARVELIKDPHTKIVQFESNDKQRMLIGSSLNLDYWIRKNLVIRIEGKYFNASSLLFTGIKSQQFTITSNLTFLLN
ncbi:MAG: porin [Crocinitomicaceae bacterium]|nr:porin [Crocinitomicaceae bacterium]